MLSAGSKLVMQGILKSATSKQLGKEGLTKMGFNITKRQQNIASAAQSKKYVTDAKQANRDARLQLAAGYRALEKLQLHEGVCNHLTLMAPAAEGDGQVMLLIPHGMHWSEVTASSLLGVNQHMDVVEGEGSIEISAACIHSGVRKTKPDGAECIFHAHMPYATALSVLKDPTIPMCHQNCMRFYKGIAYDNAYDGIAIVMDEGARLGSVLGTDNQVLMMGNHGVLVAGPTVAHAFDKLYYLERACMTCVLAMSTGKELNIISPKMCEEGYIEHHRFQDEYAYLHFQSFYRRLQRECPDFQN